MYLNKTYQMEKRSFLAVICRVYDEKIWVWSTGNITHQLTDNNLAGFATYEQRNSTSWLSFTVIFSGLTVTIGGSERKQTTNRIKQECRRLVNYSYICDNEMCQSMRQASGDLQRTSSLSFWWSGRSICSLRTLFSASHVKVWPFSKRDAANTSSLDVIYVPSS